MARYKLFVSPFAKVFLGAIFTYQVLHWTWLKLEMDESKADKNSKFPYSHLDSLCCEKGKERMYG